MIIDKMTPADLKDVCEIENMSFSVPWSRESLEGEFSLEYALYLVARENGRVVGYIGVHNICGEGEITMVAVHHDYRRGGIGEKLIYALTEQEKERGVLKINLEVRESNFAARNLYTKAGFVTDGLRKNYYTEPTENAVLMSLDISGKE